MVFQNQIVEKYNPILYAFTREHDRMELNPIRTLKEHLVHGESEIEQNEPFNFEDMLRAPSTLQEGEDATPPKAPEIESFDDSD